MNIMRKATGKVFATDVSADSLDTVLWALPSGVYVVEDSEGNPVNTVIVKAGRVTYCS